jgi:hypothetical protein
MAQFSRPILNASCVDKLKITSVAHKIQHFGFQQYLVLGMVGLP